MSSAGFERDLANFYAAWFAHQRGVLWSIALRELLLLAGFIGLAALGLSACRPVLSPPARLAPMLLSAGAVLHVVADFVFLGNVSVWRQSGWSGHPASNMIAAGRTAEAVGAVSDAVEVASFIVLGGALLVLLPVVRARGGSGALPAVIWVLIGGIGAYTVGVGAELEPLVDAGGAVAGLVAGPMMAVLLGRLGRGRPAPSSTITPQRGRPKHER